MVNRFPARVTGMPRGKGVRILREPHGAVLREARGAVLHKARGAVLREAPRS